MKLPPYIMVFDVEAMGFHGVAFAVGCVVLDTGDWREMDRRKWRCNPDTLPATVEDRAWVDQNCSHLRDVGYCDSAAVMRDLFWSFWGYWKTQGAWLAADVPWPVESNFLSACIADDPAKRQWAAPYPMLDIASLGVGKGWDPLAHHARIWPDEQPEHDPLADSHQSARLLKQILADQ
jgi:hypothetical protein